MKLTKAEKEYLTMWITADRDLIGFIRGFAPPTREDKDRKKFLNSLLEKVKNEKSC